MIHEYVKSNNYSYDDDLDPEMVQELGRVLAKLHTIDAPISNVEFLKWNKVMDSFTDDSPQSKLLTENAFLKFIKEDSDPTIHEKYCKLRIFENFRKILKIFFEVILKF